MSRGAFATYDLEVKGVDLILRTNKDKSWALVPSEELSRHWCKTLADLVHRKAVAAQLLILGIGVVVGVWAVQYMQHLAVIDNKCKFVGLEASAR